MSALSNRDIYELQIRQENMMLISPNRFILIIFLETVKTFLNLAWIYGNKCDKDKSKFGIETEPIVPPSEKEIADLLKSAMIGDADAILKQTDTIGASDPKYIYPSSG